MYVNSFKCFLYINHFRKELCIRARARACACVLRGRWCVRGACMIVQIARGLLLPVFYHLFVQDQSCTDARSFVPPALPFGLLLLTSALYRYADDVTP